jgi:hypothetical protein
MISPLVFSENWHRRPGITQITNLNIQITYDPATLQRIWRQSPNDLVNYNSVDINIGQPSVSLFYYTLPTYMKIPESIAYPFASIQNFIYSDGSTITPATSKFQLTSNSIQFQTIPHLIYIGVSKLSQNRTRQDTDSFIPITNINLTWTNTSGILSTLTQEDLYLLSLKNGLRQSWAMFSGRKFPTYGKYLDTNSLYTRDFIGPSAPICLEFGSDIQLLNEDWPGKPGVWNLQIQVTCQNNRSDNYVPQMDIIVVYHGYMVVSGQNVNLNVGFQGNLSPDNPKVSYPSGGEGYFQGGKFDLGELLGAIPAVGPLLKTGWNLLTNIIPGLSSPEYVPPPTQYMPHPDMMKYVSMTKPRKKSISRQIAPPEEDEYEE